ncbi:DNA-binding response regulator [Candidatus Magnetoovum chiemensis]|nr:DNA-binding response regulator [Candidatus Magnetoovum chiemensis]
MGGGDISLMEHAKKNISVLFVEGEVVTTLSFVNVLKRRFEKVYSAGNGLDGLEIFKRNRPDIVFTDILMPKMGGLEMISQIKQISPQTPIIVMTAINEQMYLEKANDIGIKGYLIKPIDEKEFYKILDKTTNDILSDRDE